MIAFRLFARVPFGLRPQGVFQFLLALLARPPTVIAKVISQKIKPWHTNIDHFRLRGMQRQAVFHDSLFILVKPRAYGATSEKQPFCKVCLTLGESGERIIEMDCTFYPRIA